MIAVVALSVAIGGGAAYHEFINDAINPTLRIPDGDRLVGIQQWDITSGEPDHRALHDFAAWREGLTSVEDPGVYRPMDRNLITDEGRAEPVHGVEISAVAFRLVPRRPTWAGPSSKGTSVRLRPRSWSSGTHSGSRDLARTPRLSDAPSGWETFHTQSSGSCPRGSGSL